MDRFLLCVLHILNVDFKVEQTLCLTRECQSCSDCFKGMASVELMEDAAKSSTEKMLIVEDKVEKKLRDTLTLIIPKSTNEERRNTMEMTNREEAFMRNEQDPKESSSLREG